MTRPSEQGDSGADLPGNVRKRPCGWSGHHFDLKKRPRAVVMVVIERICGHDRQSIYTCPEHEQYLISNDSMAQVPTPCPACGLNSRPAIVATYD